MLYALNVPWGQANETLDWAIHNRSQLRITVRFARQWTEAASDFVGGDPLHTIIVRRFSMPWTDRMLVGQLLPCSFRRGHKKYLFVSGVVGQTQVELDGQQWDAYVLAWPEGLQQVQRRFYYRAAIPDDLDLAVRFWRAVPAIDRRPTEPPLTEGNLVDISVGGAQIKVADAEPLDLDSSYLIEIEMPKPEAPVLVLGQARRLDPDETDHLIHCGMQFLSLDQSPRGRETLAMLARFSTYLRNLQLAENLADREVVSE